MGLGFGFLVIFTFKIISAELSAPFLLTFYCTSIIKWYNFIRRFNWKCDYLPMLGLKLNHVSKWGPRAQYEDKWGYIIGQPWMTTNILISFAIYGVSVLNIWKTILCIYTLYIMYIYWVSTVYYTLLFGGTWYNSLSHQCWLPSSYLG